MEKNISDNLDNSEHVDATNNSESFQRDEIARLKSLILSSNTENGGDVKQLFDQFKKETLGNELDIDRNDDVSKKELHEGLASMKQALDELKKEQVEQSVALHIEKFEKKVAEFTQEYQKETDELELFKERSKEEQKKILRETPYGEKREQFISFMVGEAKKQEEQHVADMVLEGVHAGYIPRFLAEKAGISVDV